MEKQTKRNSFTGSIGFILTAAGSAVGLGNIWRFPYLASKDGGGMFLVIYLILVVTFGFTLLTTEIAQKMELFRSISIISSNNNTTILLRNRWLGVKIFFSVSNRKWT